MEEEWEYTHYDVHFWQILNREGQACDLSILPAKLVRLRQIHRALTLVPRARPEILERPRSVRESRIKQDRHAPLARRWLFLAGLDRHLD